jgi:hypothetical protein
MFPRSVRQKIPATGGHGVSTSPIVCLKRWCPVRKVRKRRILLLADHLGEGRFTQPTAAIQTWRRERASCPEAAVLSSRTKRFKRVRKLSLVCAPLVGGGVPLSDLALFPRFGETTGPLRKTRTRSLYLLVGCQRGSATTGTKNRHNCRSAFVSDSCRCGNAPGERR